MSSIYGEVVFVMIVVLCSGYCGVFVDVVV